MTIRIALCASVGALLGAGSVGAAYPGANGKLAFQTFRDGNWEIYTMNPDGTDQANLTNDTDSLDAEPAWSPDGSKVAFTKTSGGDSDIYVIELAGDTATQRLTSVGTAHHPTWSPDGRRIAFDAYVEGEEDSEIYAISDDGTNMVNLTDNDAFEYAPAWSPGGDQIAYESYGLDTADYEVFVMSSWGTGQTNISNDQVAYEFEPTWSPDGSMLAFTSYRDGNSEIYTMNSDGSEQVNRSTDVADDMSASWSPDGSQIAFMSTRDGNGADILVMSATGTDVENVTQTGESEENAPDWQTLVSETGAPRALFVPIVGTPTNPTNEQSATFMFVSTQRNSTFECQLDIRPAIEDCGTATGPVSTETVVGLQEGEHTFRARAINAEGVEQEDWTTYTWTVDLTAPDVEITSAPAAEASETSASFDFLSASTDVDRYECSLDGAEFSECESPVAYSELAIGEHTFRVRAVDQASNVGPDEGYTWKTVEQGGTTPDDGSPGESQAGTGSGSGSGGGSSTDSGAQDSETAAVAIESGRANVHRRGNVSLRLRCTSGVACQGTLSLRARRGGKRSKLARKRFSITGGTGQTIRLTLSRQGRRLLARSGKLPVIATADITGEDDSRALVLRRGWR